MTHKVKAKIKATIPKTWVRLVLLIIVIGTSTFVMESTRSGRLVMVSLGAVFYRLVDVLVAVVSDRIFPDSVI